MRQKIGILRGLMPRAAHFDFTGSFIKFKLVFIGGGLLDEELKMRRNSKFEIRNSKLVPIYGFDPVKFLLGRTTHQSWVGVNYEKLLKTCKDLDYLETYELYHFFSGQAADVSKELGIPLITEVWTSFLHPAYYLPPYSLTVKKVLKQTSLFIARSSRAKKSLLKLGVPSSKVKVIYHGVDLGKFFPRKLQNSKTQNKTFLFVGEMEKYKGVETILAAWQKYHKKHKNHRLLMVGNGSMVEMVKATEGVKYLGFVEHGELPEIYRTADVFISPSINRHIGPFLWWEEFFSYTLMEAMASGLSIIGSDSGGIPEEIGHPPNGEAGNIIIRQNNVGDLLNAMEEVKVKNTNRVRAEKLFDLYQNTKILEGEILKL
jgi:glycosyltransferase involved in cell wall biosynthesis